MPIRDRVSALAFGLVLLAACSQARPPSASASTQGMVSGQGACQPAQADAASDAVNRLDTWPAVAKYFRVYHQCDDGGIAEGSSEAVARLLVDHWSTLPQLQQQIHRDPALRSFVLTHINATLDSGDLQKIAQYAQTTCPSNLGALCLDIEHAAIRALR